MKIVPCKPKQANEFIAKYHRHNKPVDHRAFRYSIGLATDEGELIGVGIAGLPIARKNDDGRTIEILRVCVREGYKNANSMLYGRLKVIGRLMGYSHFITYTLQNESASSLKAVGAQVEAILNRPSKWSRPARPRIEQAVSYQAKIRWSL
jgi:hypothetical protein